MNGKIKNIKINDGIQLTFKNLEAPPLTYGSIVINKEKFIQALCEINALNDLNYLKSKIQKLKDIIITPKNDKDEIINIDANRDTFSLCRDVLISELSQILKVQTLERAKYYLERLKNG